MKTRQASRWWTRSPASLILLVLAALGSPGCRPAPTGDGTADSGEAAGSGGGAAGSQTTPAPPAEPWTLIDAAPNTTDGIRVLVLHDMEGLSGQDDWRSFDFGMAQYELGQQMLAADVNSVVDGLFAGGATEVHVVDGHGSGNPAPDLRADLLDERAVQVLREVIRARPDSDEVFDAYNVALMERWLDVESGRWSPPEPGDPPAGARYHGYR